MAKKSKFYVVWHGVKPGVYTTWAEASAQIKGFPNAKYKSYPTRSEADYAYKVGANSSSSSTTKRPKSRKPLVSRQQIIMPSLAVDASSMGNPGIMEYRGVDTESGDEIFRMGPFSLGTNNIGEFLAIVHALAMTKRDRIDDLPIYTDSRIAMGWVKAKRAKTTLVRNAKTEKLHQLIERAQVWLNNNTYNNRIIKWETKSWGEIPADFGRK